MRPARLIATNALLRPTAVLVPLDTSGIQLNVQAVGRPSVSAWNALLSLTVPNAFLKLRCSPIILVSSAANSSKVARLVQIIKLVKTVQKAKSLLTINVKILHLLLP